MSLAMWVTRLVASVIFSSATVWVLRCIDMPSFTKVSNTFEPSSWALAKAPRPASQICCAESLMARGNSALFFFFSLLSFCSFLTMGNLRGNRDCGCQDFVFWRVRATLRLQGACV